MHTIVKGHRNTLKSRFTFPFARSEWCTFSICCWGWGSLWSVFWFDFHHVFERMHSVLPHNGYYSLSLSSSLSLSLSLSVYLSNWPLSFLWFSFAHCGQCMEKPDWAFIASFHFHWKCSPFQNAVLLFRAYSVLACVLLLRHTFNAFCMCIIFYHLMEAALSEWNSYAHLIETGLCFLFRKFLYENCFLSH